MQQAAEDVIMGYNEDVQTLHQSEYGKQLLRYWGEHTLSHLMFNLETEQNTNLRLLQAITTLYFPLSKDEDTVDKWLTNNTDNGTAWNAMWKNSGRHISDTILNKLQKQPYMNHIPKALFNNIRTAFSRANNRLTTDGFYIANTRVAGLGLFTYIPLRPGTRIGEFIGKRYTDAEAKEWLRAGTVTLKAEKKKRQYRYSYQASNGETTYIDPTDKDGNMVWEPSLAMAYVNEPRKGKYANAFAYLEEGADGVSHIFVTASSFIAPHEEITMLYSDTAGGEDMFPRQYEAGMGCHNQIDGLLWEGRKNINMDMTQVMACDTKNK